MWCAEGIRFILSSSVPSSGYRMTDVSVFQKGSFSVGEILYPIPNLSCKHSVMALRKEVAIGCRFTLNLGLPEKLNCNSKLYMKVEKNC